MSHFDLPLNGTPVPHLLDHSPYPPLHFPSFFMPFKGLPRTTHNISRDQRISLLSLPIDVKKFDHDKMNHPEESALEYQPKVISPFVHSYLGEETKGLLVVQAWARPFKMPNRMGVTLIPQEGHRANNVSWPVGHNINSFFKNCAWKTSRVWFSCQLHFLNKGPEVSGEAQAVWFIWVKLLHVHTSFQNACSFPLGNWHSETQQFKLLYELQFEINRRIKCFHNMNAGMIETSVPNTPGVKV